MNKNIKCGAEVLENLPGKKSVRVGLITNPTAITSDLRPTYDILMEKFTLAAMFSPEHGVRGDAQAGLEITEYVDAVTGITVYSTFGRGKPAAFEAMLTPPPVSECRTAPAVLLWRSLVPGPWC